MKPSGFSYSRTYPVTPEAAFDAVLTTPLPFVFARRFGPLGAVRAVHEEPAEWGSVGQSRVVELSDGATSRETLTFVEAPHRFEYQLSELTGPLTLLASVVDGAYVVKPAGTGARITWSWAVTPANPAARLAMPAFGRFWQGYARQAFEQLEQVLVD